MQNLRIEPTLLGCHSCWSESPGTSHLGMHSTGIPPEQSKDSWRMP
uniref:Uncharacterized protein n=1 Tax=Cyprinus carpio TaxID=7962 RepID=A0A8C1KXY9_CYPCA